MIVPRLSPDAWGKPVDGHPALLAQCADIVADGGGDLLGIWHSVQYDALRVNLVELVAASR
jgi:hypothetical protein